MNGNPTVLLIDDEERVVRSLKMLLRSRYDVLTTVDPHQALEWVRSRRIHVVVSDQRMPLMAGVDLLRSAREISPHTMRILLTGYSELDAVIASVNEGEIFRFINKPWDPHHLQDTVAQAVDIASTLFEAAGESERQRSEPKVRRPVGVLVMDEDPAMADLVREVMQTATGAQHSVYWCDAVDEAFEYMAQQPVGILVSDIRIDDEDISGALKVLKQEHPEILTIVLTSFRDTTVLIDLINQGQVYRFLPKPVSRNLLARSLSAGIAYHETLRASPRLTASHVVEKSLSESDQRLASRLRGFIDRIRGRTVAAV